MTRSDLERGRCQLKSWVVERCLICGVAAFFVTLELAHPPFGMGGPNYLLAALVAIAAAAMTGALAGVRAFLRLQQIIAAGTGSTLYYQLGRWLRGQLTKKTSR